MGGQEAQREHVMSMMYMNPPTGPSLVGPGHAAQQQQPPQVHQATPSASYQEWLKAWKSWAGTRKRGKMAQFIVQKLEENVSQKKNAYDVLDMYVA